MSRHIQCLILMYTIFNIQISGYQRKFNFELEDPKFLHYASMFRMYVTFYRIQYKLACKFEECNF